MGCNRAFKSPSYFLPVPKRILRRSYSEPVPSEAEGPGMLVILFVLLASLFCHKEAAVFVIQKRPKIMSRLPI